MPWAYLPTTTTFSAIEQRPFPPAVVLVWREGETVRTIVRSLTGANDDTPLGTFRSQTVVVLLPAPPTDTISGFRDGTGHRYELTPTAATELPPGPRTGTSLVETGQMVVVTGEWSTCEVLVLVGTDGYFWMSAPIEPQPEGGGRARLRLRGPDQKFWIYRVAWPTRECGAAGR